MPLHLEIVSEHRDIVGDDAVREFQEDGGTIGRSLRCDWILPDPDRYISSRHAIIDCKAGVYYLADTSSNGVYINGETEPIGKSAPRRLFNGDLLRLGDFEIVVTIDEGEDLDMPKPPPATVVPDNIEQLVPEASTKTGLELLDEDEITGDDEFQSALFGSKGKSRSPAPANDVPEAESDGSDGSSQDLFDAFAEGIGISRSDFDDSADLAQVMRNAGEVLREYIGGMEKLIASRADLKDAFRLDQTIILPRHNNPLKLSQTTADSVKQLLIGQEGEYLGPRDAVHEVSRDLLAHQEAFLGAMAVALGEFAGRFNPEEISDQVSGSSKRKPLFGFLRKLKYWQRYLELYPTMTATGGGRFPQTFAEEFVRAYESQIAEFNRLGPTDGSTPTPLLAPLQENDADEGIEADNTDLDEGVAADAAHDDDDDVNMVVTEVLEELDEDLAENDVDFVVTEVLEKLDDDVDENDIDLAVTAVLEGRGLDEADDTDDQAKV